ncbi:MAG: hypothetical protein LC751_09790, partial [Actinobacteria bacterium]|nr:hypothetical protein [Actinomycetota bacterium]
HEGHVFKMVGDACYAAFAAAPRALEAALAGQRALFAEPWDEQCRIRLDGCRQARLLAWSLAPACGRSVGSCTEPGRRSGTSGSGAAP